MLDRIQRLLVSANRAPLGGLVVVLTLCSFMIATTILGDATGYPAITVLGCGIGLLLWVLCAVALLCNNLRHANDETRNWLETPFEFVCYGAICAAIYALGMALAEYYPAVHPITGELWVLYGMLAAIAAGSVPLGVVGFADPRICLAVSRNKRSHTLPLSSRVTGWTLLIGGFAVGGYVAFTIAG